MSPVNPMMIAAQIGPIPTMSVSVVPDAATAPATRFYGRRSESCAKARVVGIAEGPVSGAHRPLDGTTRQAHSPIDLLINDLTTGPRTSMGHFAQPQGANWGASASGHRRTPTNTTGPETPQISTIPNVSEPPNSRGKLGRLLAVSHARGHHVGMGENLTQYMPCGPSGAPSRPSIPPLTANPRPSGWTYKGETRL